MATDESRGQIDQIEAWFSERGRQLLLSDHGDEGWYAAYPRRHLDAGTAAPFAVGATQLEAALNAQAKFSTEQAP